MHLYRTLFIAAALVLPMAFSHCSRSGGYQGGGAGGAGWGGEGQDPLDYYGLPQRDERYSLYGPGSEKVRRDPVPPVYFAFDSAVIAPGEMPKVQRLAQIAHGTLVIIAGHTDITGTFEYNRALGERRALAVRKALLRLGVSGGNVQTISYGEDMTTGRGDELDRRAEFGAVIR